MTLKPVATAGAAVFVAAALLLAGCAGVNPESGARPAGTGSVGATASISPSVSADATKAAAPSAGSAASGKNDVSREDLAEIKRQLDAMQKALDGIKMPTDNDFSGAEGAVY